MRCPRNRSISPLLALLVALPLGLLGCGPSGAHDYNRGIEHFNKQEFAQAAEALELAIKHNPEFAEAHHSLGVCKIELDQLDAAQAALERAESLFGGGKQSATYDGKTVTQKRALVARHLGLIEEKRYTLRREADGQAALAHLRKARDYYQQAIGLDPAERHSRQGLDKILAFFKRHNLAAD